jgi:bifunctional UDP-N-acetylglucosamine pyrophosphorylase/glucosamine-1-phosphate N-acetyltransferase
VGDAVVGNDSNIAAGNITANFDGYDKHATTIGDRVRTGSDTTIVAPVTIGDDAFTAAGSVITRDVPPGSLGVAREEQKNIEGYTERRAARRLHEQQDT